jgi:hypothetical protein
MRRRDWAGTVLVAYFTESADGVGVGRAGCGMGSISHLDDFRALEPFFRVVEQSLAGLADGAHFFDLLAEDVVFDYIITVPTYPRHVVGRAAVAELYRPYGEMFVLNRTRSLAPGTRKAA